MENMKSAESVCIVGAGISGVSAAHYLAKKGYRQVTVLEKADRVGGKCYSILYQGKTYEMGTLIGLPSYYATKQLMAEFGLTDQRPLLERGFYNLYGRKTSQIPMDQLPDFTREFKRLPEILQRYERLKEPGFLGLPEELCQPFASWCEQNGLTVIRQVFMHYFSTFGFGSIHEVPAAYVLKFLTYEDLLSFIEITHMITWPEGASELVRRMAEQVKDLRLTCEVRRIEADASGKVRVETDQETAWYDKVIYTASMPNAAKLLHLSAEEQSLLGRIRHERFRVYAYRVEGIPRMSGYIPGNLDPGRRGQMMAWYHRWADLGDTDLITVYVAENEGMTDREMREAVEQALLGLGGVNLRFYMMKRWEHFPHVDAAALREGFYEQLDRMQGRDHIYFAGEIMNFPTLEKCTVYAKHLIDRFF
ncbi:flavin monoamine oxidase family protein [Paenibacillus tengchongensis]|uniref:flavin monoamine oxidase family protein n=1 Tax=Paenibacillus tengchongensis TaxID=2608684 RepID=UPI00124EE26C|nr:FAD-dependent oxidoreductase [Paenibacillus tengchongensis]